MDKMGKLLKGVLPVLTVQKSESSVQEYLFLISTVEQMTANVNNFDGVLYE